MPSPRGSAWSNWRWCSFAQLLAAGPLFAATAELPGDRMLAAYFEQETQRISGQALAGVETLTDWTRVREIYRAQLQEMLGISPWPERTPLQSVVTGRLEHPEFFVEKLHFQSRPGLYVTGNLYVPKDLRGRAPAILYVCGHAGISRGPVPFGAKAVYHQHGAWLARHGYVCLMIDPIEVGELVGIHKGTKREGMWWWNARGYTPAGVETWNAMRALDYLQSRPEVDGEKLGMTGRSGGGVTSWYTAALDERIKVVAPIAGITDVRNYVIDRTLANHCDCVFMVNTYRWDYHRIAMLVAPRPLLFGNTDKDEIFLLDGVLRIHADVAAVYRLYQAPEKLALLIADGPHKDSQDLQIPALRWFNRHLKGEEPLIQVAAEDRFERRDLAVFEKRPAAERTTRAHEFFVPAAPVPAVPENAAAWSQLQATWRTALQGRSFAAWPKEEAPVNATRMAQETAGGVTFTTWEFTSQGVVRLPLWVFSPAQTAASVPVRLHVLDEKSWAELAATVPPEWIARVGGAGNPPAGSRAPSAPLPDLLAQVARGELTLACLPPRGIGPTRWSGDNRNRVNSLRSFMVFGQTLEGMRVWDIRRAVATLRRPEVVGPGTPLVLSGERIQAVNALYASLFTDGVTSLDLIAPPSTHHTGPDYLNVLRTLDVPQAVALAAERASVKISGGQPEEWKWAANTARNLGWPADRLQW